jgi:hypothetical protein
VRVHVQVGVGVVCVDVRWVCVGSLKLMMIIGVFHFISLSEAVPSKSGSGSPPLAHDRLGLLNSNTARPFLLTSFVPVLRSSQKLSRPVPRQSATLLRRAASAKQSTVNPFRRSSYSSFLLPSQPETHHAASSLPRPPCGRRTQRQRKEEWNLHSST